jgi:hypothetical protein
MGIGFSGALSVLGVNAEQRSKPDPAIVRQHEALRIIRDWCRQTGKHLRREYLLRHRIETWAKQKLVVDPENLIGWELLRIAYDGAAKNEFLLDEIGLCRTDDERLHAWRFYRNDF